VSNLAFDFSVAPRAAAAPVADDRPSLAGTVKRIRFASADKTFFIAVVDQIVDGKPEEAVMVSNSEPMIGMQMKAVGAWEKSKYGPQFKAQHIELVVPEDTDGLATYLTSLKIPGVGKTMCKRIADTLGKNLLRQIEDDPSCLMRVPGLKGKRAERVVKKIIENKKTAALELFLFENGLGAGMAVRVVKELGNNAMAEIKSNPYTLTRVSLIGFEKADQFARRLGIEADSVDRLRAGLSFTMESMMGRGHTCAAEQTLFTEAAKLLQQPVEKISAVLDHVVEKGGLAKLDVAGELMYALPWLAKQEMGIATEIRRLMGAKMDAIEIAPEVMESLNEKQRQAVTLSLSSAVSVITGMPGTGKTHVVKVVLDAFGEGVFRLTAPTGRAAMQMSDATGRPAATMHRLLAWRGGEFTVNEHNPLDCKLLVVDESSMPPVPLFYSLLKALPTGCRVIFVGDINQIPAVGAGDVLRDLMASKVIPVTALTEPRRFGSQSGIEKNCRNILAGQPAEEFDDFHRVMVGDDVSQEELAKLAMTEAMRLHKMGYAWSDIQVISPMRKLALGAMSLNTAFQMLANPTPSASVQVGGMRVGVGDRIMQLRSNYDLDIFNGDIGEVLSIDNEEDTITADFGRGRVVTIEAEDWDALALGNAITVHKSQGSQYKAVIHVMATAHFVMLNRNLYFTAVSRAQKHVSVVGHAKAEKIALRSLHQEVRSTLLKAALLDDVMLYKRTDSEVPAFELDAPGA
jgi:exodeoxyribonuclease V alpha subunit